MYKSMPLSHFVPAYPSPSPCPQVHALHLSLYCCPAPRFFRTIIIIFRFHTYVLAYSTYFSLSDLLHSLWQSLGPSISLQITQFRFFLWLSNIPLYICATSYLFICWWTLRLQEVNNCLTLHKCKWFLLSWKIIINNKFNNLFLFCNLLPAV